MSESFVDLSYRGLNLGKRVKLTQVRPSMGYLEMPTPMPVGTAIGIATEDGLVLEATVAEVHEQVTGSERTPGMIVRPKLEADAARGWWKQRVTMPDVERPLPPADATGKVTLVARREGVPQLVDDGRNTGVMDAIDESHPPPATSVRTTNPGIGAASLPEELAQRDLHPAPVEAPQRDSQPALVDDGKRTMMMSAIDLEALGLDPSSSDRIPIQRDTGPLSAVDSGSFEAASDQDSGPNDDKPESKSKKKKRRR